MVDKTTWLLLKTKRGGREGRERERKALVASHLHYIYGKVLTWAIEFLFFLIVSFKYFTITILL